jgi:hypothetical protein
LKSVLAVGVLALAAPHAGLAAGRAGPALPVLPATAGTIAPGTWVLYSLYNRTTRQPGLLRLSALEREGKAQWFEMGVTDHRQLTLRTKVLVEGPIAAPKRVLKAIVQPPGQQPLLLPDKLAAKQVPSFSSRPTDKTRLVSRGRLKVAAGTFVCERHRSTSGPTRDIWLSEHVPGWPLVKLETPTVTVELAAHGMSARSQIEGTPLKLDEKLLQSLPGIR